jgi:alcohol dehydrogenase
MTAMDAAGHCIEAVYSLARNPFSFSLACTALKLIRDNLKTVIEKPQDKEARLNMALAASVAGAAFSNSMVGLAHALAHSSGEVCHLPHGLAVSIFLPAVMEFNLDKASLLLADLLPFVGSEEDLVKTPTALRADKVIAIIKEWREYLYEKTGLARTLGETGLVSETHLEQIASSTLADGSSLYNPQGASVEDCLVLIRKCL